MAISANPARDWRLTILEQRSQIEDLIHDSPSLKDTFSQKVSVAYARALVKTELETGLAQSSFPKNCPFCELEILDPNFWPKSADD